MFMFDIETLGIESTSVVLSAAITYFDFGDKVFSPDKDQMQSEYNRYAMTSCFVKFKTNDQLLGGRIVDPDTVKWWSKQSELARKASLDPSEDDLDVVDGIRKIKSYINANGGNNQIIWARGSLDQMVFDSLCRSVGEEHAFMYNMWRDVRTAVDLLSSNSKGGYSVIPNFNPDLYVVKHIPQNDCSLDILQMLYYV